MRFLCLAASAFLCGVLPLALQAADLAKSEWVTLGSDGRLSYKTTAKGDRISDFSSAGYEGGGVALPDVPVKETVKPSGGDDTARIQAAIDAVSKLPLEGEFRGAVLLSPGTYLCSGSISIAVPGVVLRGSGSEATDPNRSTIVMSGARHAAVSVGRGSRQADEESGDAREDRSATAAQTRITDSYVPSGTLSFSVESASGFAPGDFVSIERPVTQAWIHFMDMDTLVRNGKKETWVREGTRIPMDRRIVAVSGSQITVDRPITDSIDSKYLNPPGAVMVKRAPVPLVDHVGVENLHIECPEQHVAMTAASYSGIHVNAQDCWIRGVVIDNTVGTVGLSGRRITLTHVVANHSVPTVGAAKPADFGLNAAQLLLDRCSGHGDDVFYSATGGGQTGPIVMLHCRFDGNGHIQPHQRWSTGMLVDNCDVPNGGIDFMNRGEMGSGHGWTMGWGVIWNSHANTFIVQNPPGSANWLIGCSGTLTPTARPFGKGSALPGGTVDSMGKSVEPQSLYLAQLSERMGPQALRAIGY